MKSQDHNCRVFLLLVTVILVPLIGLCQKYPSVSDIKDRTRNLLTAFLIKEDMIALEEMLDDSLKFYWPNTRLDTKEGVLKACQSVITTKDSRQVRYLS